MNSNQSPVKSVAPLRNVATLSEMIMRIMDRDPRLPGLGTYTGPSGFGKTYAAIYAVLKYNAFHVQVKSAWTSRYLCLSILKDMGINPGKSVGEMIDQIGMELALSKRPLIIDEADELLKNDMIKKVRDIYEASLGTVILIGEENLPHALKKWERIAGRIYDSKQAQPGTLDDVNHLSRLYAPGIQISEDLLKAIHEVSSGSIRRICVNLAAVNEVATNITPPDAPLAINLDIWKQTGVEFSAGKLLPRRNFA